MTTSTNASLTIRLSPKDNVVVSRADILEGTDVPGEGIATVERIPTGHKLATRAVAEGEAVVKYDQVIGFATRAIAPGSHVHVHNCGMAEFDRDYAFCAGTDTDAGC
jgi:altronate hydrolase